MTFSKMAVAFPNAIMGTTQIVQFAGNALLFVMSALAIKSARNATPICS